MLGLSHTGAARRLSVCLSLATWGNWDGSNDLWSSARGKIASAGTQSNNLSLSVCRNRRADEQRCKSAQMPQPGGSATCCSERGSSRPAQLTKNLHPLLRPYYLLLLPTHALRSKKSRISFQKSIAASSVVNSALLTGGCWLMKGRTGGKRGLEAIPRAGIQALSPKLSPKRRWPA